jgi:hypothetical protein
MFMLLAMFSKYKPLTFVVAVLELPPAVCILTVLAVALPEEAATLIRKLEPVAVPEVAVTVPANMYKYPWLFVVILACAI